MNILLAPDSFKDSLTATEVCVSMRKGILKVNPDATIVSLPMADGGEGTLEALTVATKGKIIVSPTFDSLMRPIESRYAILGDGETAVIELAQASGMELLKPEERNPMLTNTYGTGILILEAFNRGCRKFIICIGGSATHDVGTGILAALGIQFYDKSGNDLIPTGGNLGTIIRVEQSSDFDKFSNCEFQIACDVTNPLLGVKGAAEVFSRQKGATETQVLQLEENTKIFSVLLKNQIGRDVSTLAGAGAAGGVGAGLCAFMHAKLESGFEIVARTTELENAIRKADLIFTGEGKVDFQTQFGKTPFGVAQLAKKHEKLVFCLAGSVGEGADALYEHGITAFYSIVNQPMSLEEAIKRAPELIEQTVESIMRSIRSQFENLSI
ncbi:MAG: glycerate kinase [Flavobacteriaceae bacterium]|nr:glycerate kinase [Flavobacteriaceae bacterium]